MAPENVSHHWAYREVTPRRQAIFNPHGTSGSDLPRSSLKPTVGQMNNKLDQKLFPEHKALDSEGETLDLTLFKSDTCFYCHRVLSTVRSLQVPLTLRDTRKDPQARAKLIEVGGKRQVPCLFINGVPLYESSDIIRFFQGLVIAKTEL